MLALMRFAWIVIAIALALVGACGEDRLADLKAAKATVCACRTAACADEAMKTVPPPQGSADHRSQKLAREIQDCLVKAYDRDRPTTDPDAEIDPAHSGSGSGSDAGSGSAPR
jgi:hypothetical protein